ncbi:EAL domain-containing protein [Deinococcus aquatilis]|uniref:EAL domain-containing protein n=1 Tax=Deinococcus aquatilis TaxID=519440 RepID=UPI000375D1DA|nr:EAL domain-containing protein [Deinococcus aquatilis]
MTSLKHLPFSHLSHLSLRRQANLLILTIIIPSVLLQAVVIPQLLLQRFRTLEQEQLTDSGETIKRAYVREETRIRAFTKNFAAWSETFRFAQGRNPGFLNSNLIPSTFEGGNVSVWGVTNRTGQLLSAATYNSSGLQTGEAARSLVAVLIRQTPSDSAQTASGVLQINGKFYLMASQPVTRDDGSGLAGRFLMARELTPQALSEVVSPGADTRLRLIPPASAVPENNDPADQLTLTLPLLSPDGVPSATLRVTQPRRILEAGRAATVQISLITALSALIALLLGTAFIRRQVLQVVERYDRGVQQMRQDPEYRLTVQGNNELGRLATTINELTDQHRRQYTRIQTMQERDALTGLLNRDGLVLAARPYSLQAAVIVQIGSLESLSGLYGSVRADQLLLEFAARLREHAPASLWARIRSDTFALLCNQPLSSLMPAITAAARPYPVNTGEVQLRLYVGLVEGDGLKSAEELLECAELALQETHEFGDFTRTYTRQTRQRLTRTRTLEESLRSLTDETFTLHYQTIVDLNGQRPVAFEALLRWQHPELGAVSPAEFIPLAERGGHIYALGQWVLRQAARDLLSVGHPTLNVNVNVSPLQLLSPSFAEDTLATIRQVGLPPPRLVLEVTESAVLENLELATAQLNTLRNAGIQIALDDFGAGYSSLSLLSRLPIDVIKLDRTFLTEALSQPAAQTVLAQTVVLATQLGFPVVAEGIENIDTLVLLRQMGVRRGQGYLLGRPAPFGESLGRLRGSS